MYNRQCFFIRNDRKHFVKHFHFLRDNIQNAASTYLVFYELSFKRIKEANKVCQ